MADTKQNGGRQDARIDYLEKAVDELKVAKGVMWKTISDQRDRITSLKGTLVTAIVLSNIATGLLAQWLF